MRDIYEVKESLRRLLRTVDEKIHEPNAQRKIILVIVCIALLLDNMLYMVIVPIIPQYLRNINAFGIAKSDNGEEYTTIINNYTVHQGNQTIIMYNVTTSSDDDDYVHYIGEGGAIGLLFASKAIVQLAINPFTGTLIDRIGYDIPMMIGLLIMCLSTTVFAFAESYAVLFFARSLQGLGSAFADTSGLAMIADRYSDVDERTTALGIALAFISFGCLVAPPFGGVLFEFAGKVLPFMVLALVSFIDCCLLLLVMKPQRELRSLTSKDVRLKGTPIYRLLMDPHIAVVAGALAMSNVSLAFLEPTISLWMRDTMNAEEWKIGLVWLPAFLPHIAGVYLTVKLAKKYPKYQWLMAATGIAIEGLFCAIVPFTNEFGVLIIPICGICFGIALVDTAMLPTLGYLVDVRYVSLYGSVYAIADISYSIAYAIGPIVAGQIVQTIGFMWLNIGIMLSNVLYAPVLLYIRHIYTYKPFENECDVLVDDPPSKQYMTYMQNGSTDGKLSELSENTLNHLEVEKKKSWVTFDDTKEIGHLDSVEPNDSSFLFHRQ